MDLLEQLQIGSVEVCAAEVLRSNTAGVERDTLAVGQRSQLLIKPGMVGHHARGNTFHVGAFRLFLGHFPVFDFLRSAACCFLDKIHILLTHFHDGGPGRSRLSRRF